jgi:hypothetical protein
MALVAMDQAMIIFGLLVAVIAGIIVWSIRYHTRVIGYVASGLESPCMSWGIWSDRLLNGYWRGLPVRVRATYANPTTLSVTVQRPTPPPELDACMTHSGRVVFRSIRSGLFLIRTIACASEDDLFKPSKEHVHSDIVSYFTRARMEHVEILLRDLGWARFHKSSNGIGVSMSGRISSSWNPDQARDHIAKTLTELRGLES